MTFMSFLIEVWSGMESRGQVKNNDEYVYDYLQKYEA